MGHKHSSPAIDVEKQREKLLADVIKVEKEIKYLETAKKQKKDGKETEKESSGWSESLKKYNLSEINWA